MFNIFEIFFFVSSAIFQACAVGRVSSGPLCSLPLIQDRDLPLSTERLECDGWVTTLAVKIF